MTNHLIYESPYSIFGKQFEFIFEPIFKGNFKKELKTILGLFILNSPNIEINLHLLFCKWFVKISIKIN